LPNAYLVLLTDGYGFSLDFVEAGCGTRLRSAGVLEIFRARPEFLYSPLFTLHFTLFESFVAGCHVVSGVRS